MRETQKGHSCCTPNFFVLGVRGGARRAYGWCACEANENHKLPCGATERQSELVEEHDGECAQRVRAARLHARVFAAVACDEFALARQHRQACLWGSNRGILFLKYMLRAGLHMLLYTQCVYCCIACAFCVLIIIALICVYACRDCDFCKVLSLSHPRYFCILSHTHVICVFYLTRTLFVYH